MERSHKVCGGSAIEGNVREPEISTAAMKEKKGKGIEKITDIRK